MRSTELLITLLAAVAFVAGDEKPSLDALCANKLISLTSMSQVQGLIEEARDKEGCDHYRNSLLDLEEVLTQVQAGATWSLQFTSKLEKYHKKYIENEKDKANDNIPTSLRQFFISMAFQISAEYKMILVNNLEVDSKKYINDSDYETIEQLDSMGAILVDKDADISDFDDIILLNDLARIVEGVDHAPVKLMIKIKTTEVLRRLIQTCTTKFSPIYEKLILPLISLSNMGYNYRGSMLERELAELKTNSLVRKWYKIVQVCETFKAMEIFEASDEVVDGNKQVFTFVSKEEGEKLRETQGSVNSMQTDEKPIEYQPEAFHRNELWIEDQKELASLLKNYKASSNEEGRLEGLVMRRLFTRLKDSIMSGKLMVFAGKFVKDTLIKDQEDSSSLSEELITMIDDAIEESEEIAMVNKLDGAVAGRDRVPPRVGKIKRVQDKTKWTKKIERFTCLNILPSKGKLLWRFIVIGFMLSVIILTVMFVAG